MDTVLRPLCEQHFQGVTTIDPERPTDGVADLGRWVDAEGVENRGADVIGADRVAGRIGGPSVGGAVDGPAADAGAGQDGAIAVRPVLAAGVAASDVRLAAELADPDDQRLVEQSPRSRSSSKAESPRSAGGISRFLSWLKLSPCVSQKFMWSSCQFTETSGTPASIKRRASKRHCPWIFRP